MRLTSFGHSCLLVEVADLRVLLDPGTFSSGFEQLRDLDAVLVTHQHPDHCDPDRFAPLVEANPGARVLLETQTADQLRDGGLRRDVETLTSGTDVTLESRGSALTVSPVGQRHAIIHADIPRIDNTGVVLRADGEPSFFHPGDALDAEPGDVDLLGVPLNAPWCAMKETIEFVRRIGAPRFVPIHDGLLAENGRELYLRQVTNLSGEVIDGLSVLDLADRKPAQA
ncbi:MBL fold metallo-hydrolase [Piscicoccus intestinalis]|uniref:MBL fold metallo-hydrolase n=1 Tax=Piscicoccus intestinalis TaxID=746033 RepID=UPI000838AB90|nr:MBL fold metallo-hydrolase [Piscicoccus intestinalis]